MKIRTITNLINPNNPDYLHELDNFSSFNDSIIKALSEAGYEVQTSRISTIPFPHLVNLSNEQESITTIKKIEDQFQERNYDYYSFGPALPQFPTSYEIIPAFLENTKNAFFSAVIAEKTNGVHLQAIQNSARIIEKASRITMDGFTNLRFTALANVKPFGPFFPGSYHQGTEPAFSLAIESADLAVKAFKQAQSLKEAKTLLVNSIADHAEKLTQISNKFAKSHNLLFKGMDFSLAPFPDDDYSLGGAIELLGIEQLGLTGSLAAAAFVAECLDEGNWLKVGFNGLMLPVLEDTILAKRTIENTLTLKDLILYSAVCGTGLDTVPLPGDSTAEQIAGVLADIAALSIRLDKPLTSRLMPVPGKKAGEMTTFDFEFFCNGRILELPAKPLKRFLKNGSTFNMKPKHKFEK